MIESIVYLPETCRLFVVIVLLAAASGKTLHFARFRDGLARSFPKMSNMITTVAVTIILIEWALCAMVLSPQLEFRKAGLIVAVIMFACFAIVISWSLMDDHPITCNCFGATDHRITSHDLARNLLYISASAIAWKHVREDFFLDSMIMTTLIGFALTAFLITSALQDISSLIRSPTDD